MLCCPVAPSQGRALGPNVLTCSSAALSCSAARPARSNSCCQGAADNKKNNEKEREREREREKYMNKCSREEGQWNKSCPQHSKTSGKAVRRGTGRRGTGRGTEETGAGSSSTRPRRQPNACGAAERYWTHTHTCVHCHHIIRSRLVAVCGQA